jgi:hypothetical protein
MMTNPRSRVRVALLVLAGATAGVQAAPGKYVLLIDARAAENAPCIALETANGCGAPPGRSFLDEINGTALKIVNRKFLTDYAVQVDGVTTPLPPGIRGVEEAVRLSPGAAALIAPPSKGAGPSMAVPAIAPKTSAEFLAQLLDETQAEKPGPALDADYAEVMRQKQAVADDLDGLERQYTLVLKPRASAGGSAAERCDAVGVNPTLPDVRDCLAQELRTDSSGPSWTEEPFTDESGFRAMGRRTKDLVSAVGALQAALTQANLPDAVATASAAFAQFEKNVAAFRANVAALRAALALYDDLRDKKNGAAFEQLRKDQLRMYFRALLKLPASDDTAAAIDKAELNRLVDEYYGAMAGRSFSDKPLGAWRSRVTTWEMAGGGDLQPLRDQLRPLERGVQIELPQHVADVNAAESRLLARVNYVYDHSAVAVPLVKQIDLGKHTGNLKVYYSVYRIENFARYVVVAASSSAAPKGGEAATGPAGVKVASGMFEVHRFDSATVVAAFAFSPLRHNDYQTRPVATGDQTTHVVTLASTERFQPHVILGLDWYVHPRDTYPGMRHRASDTLGIFGGVSLNALNNYFVGLAFEPTLGVNFVAGAHFGTETALRSPYRVGDAAPTTAAPTYERRANGVFFSAGFDLRIFQSVFGKVTGIGTPPTPTTPTGGTR